MTKRRLVWSENLGQDDFSQFADPVILVGPTDFYVYSFADLDGDGDLDLVAANGESGTVVWYEQVTPANFSAARAIAPAAYKPAWLLTSDHGRRR
ncbi:MAG: hypothetical protein R3C28_07025 [Pirellulaceae bacterium]